MVEFLIAFFSTLALLPAVIAILRHGNVLDIPTERSSHVTPVYRGGGTACFVAAVASAAISQLTGKSVSWAGIVAAACLGLLGLIDDIRGVQPRVRLAVQLVVGLAAGWAVGHGAIWALLGVLVVPISVNAVNFMDGIDGITGLSIGLWGLSAIVLGEMHNAESLVVLGALTAGVSFGFLPANLPTARLFLGDVGSYFLGGLVGVGFLVGIHSHVPALPLLSTLLIYLVDTGSTIARRAYRKAPLMAPHREHIYQALVSEMGASHALTSAIVAVVSAALGLDWIWCGPWIALPSTAVVLTAYIVVGAKLMNAQPPRPPS